MAYPTSAITFTTRNVGDTIQPAHVNDLQTEVAALEAALLGTLQHHVVLGAGKNLTVGGTTTLTGNIVSNLLFTDAAYDIGQSGATRPRHIYASGNGVFGGTLNVTGNITLSGTGNAVGTITSGVWNAGAVTSSGALQGDQLDITRSIATNRTRAYIRNTSTSGYSVGLALMSSNSNAAERNWIIRSSVAANGDFAISQTTAAGADPFTDAVTNKFILGANGDATFSGLLIVSGNSATYGLQFDGSNGGGIAATHASGAIRFYSGGTTRSGLIDTDRTWTMDVYGAGTATFSAAGKISSVSDERLKNITGPLGYGLAEVLALNPIRHTWNGLSGLDDPKHTEYGGFSAQNVKAAMPLAVGVDARGYLTLSDRPILGATVNAIKSLHAVDVDHESRLRALEERML